MASRRIRSFVAILRPAGDSRQNGSFRPDPVGQDRQEVLVFQLLAVKEKQQAGDARAAPRERPGGSTPFMRMHSGRTAYPPPRARARGQVRILAVLREWWYSQ